MRWIGLSFGILMLSACSTTTPVSLGGAAQSDDRRAKSCALYGWTTGETRELIFFADAKTARYDSVSGPVDLVAESKFPALLYADPDGGRVELRLGEGEAMSGGMRYPSARIVTQTREGWDRLRPVGVIQNCPVKTAQAK